MDTKYGNLALALSNLPMGLWAIINLGDFFSVGVISCAMCASVVYHLAERKFGLPGIEPFARYTKDLLQIDRAFAMVATLHILLRRFLGMHGSRLFIYTDNWTMLCWGLGALFFAATSELCNKFKWNRTGIVLHCIWHFAAFWFFGFALSEK